MRVVAVASNNLRDLDTEGFGMRARTCYQRDYLAPQHMPMMPHSHLNLQQYGGTPPWMPYCREVRPQRSAVASTMMLVVIARIRSPLERPARTERGTALAPGTAEGPTGLLRGADRVLAL
jgi:hypothetical protein